MQEVFNFIGYIVGKWFLFFAMGFFGASGVILAIKLFGFRVL